MDYIWKILSVKFYFFQASMRSWLQAAKQKPSSLTYIYRVL